MLWLHFIRGALTALAVAVPLVASAQQPPVPPPLPDAGATNFTIFLRGAPIGSEQIAVSRTATGWTIASSGRLGAPIDVVARRLQVRYTQEWRPIEFTLDGTVRGQPQTLARERSRFGLTRHAPARRAAHRGATHPGDRRVGTE